MTSSTCNLDGSAAATAAALIEAENFARRCGLGQKRLLHLRLLAEELLGMAGNVVDVKQGVFWIEREGMTYRFCLNAYVQTGKSAKKQLLGASSSGENTYYQGVTGKIRQAVDWLSQGDINSIGAPRGVAGGLLPSAQEIEWSLKCYRESIRQEERAETWDELEKSVLTKLADDILVGVRSNQISITILKVLC